MRKKLLSILLVLVLILSAALPSSVVYADQERVLQMDYSPNMGFPSMYTSKSNGPGFVSVTFAFDTLVWKDKDGEFNLLCEEYEVSEDGKIYTFLLREDVTFHDGTPFTAEDVKFTFDYQVEHPYQWTSTTMVKETRVVDDRTVEVELHDVYVPFITDVAGNLHILPKHIFEQVEDPTTYNEPDAAIGTGPFLLENYDPVAGSFVFVKNPDWYYGEVQIDKLILAPTDDSRNAIMAGEIDASGGLRYKAAQAIKDEPNIGYLEGQSIQINRFSVNFDIPALAVKEVRQAMSYAIDRTSIVEKAAEGAGIVATAGFVHPESEWYNPEVTTYEYDIEKAKTLLADAGAIDSDGDGILEYEGEKMSYEFLFSEDDLRQGEMLVGFMKDIGIELVPQTMDDGSVKARFSEGDFEVVVNRHGTFGGDPKYMAALATDTAGAIRVSIQGGTRWQNAAYDELFYQSLRETDIEKRRAIVHELQAIVAEELPTLATFFPVNAAVYNSAIFDGFYFTPDGIGAGCPFTYNKMVFVTGTWNAD